MCPKDSLKLGAYMSENDLDLGLLRFLPLPPDFWVCRCVASCLLGKRSTNCTASPDPRRTWYGTYNSQKGKANCEQRGCFTSRHEVRSRGAASHPGDQYKVRSDQGSGLSSSLCLTLTATILASPWLYYASFIPLYTWILQWAPSWLTFFNLGACEMHSCGCNALGFFIVMAVEESVA